MKVIAFIASIMLCCNVCAQTSYYKLTKKVVNGTTSTSVSGGQFISFSDDCCYESDKDGYSVGHGRLQYKYSSNGVKTYIGNAYWGKVAFKFNSDKSVLNVVDGDNVYVYRRTSAPAGANTCSLIRKSQSSGYSAPMGTDIPNASSVPEYESGTNPYKGHYETREERCVECNGRGYNVQYIYHGGSNSSSMQRRCSFCHGKGTVTKREYVLDN